MFVLVVIVAISLIRVAQNVRAQAVMLKKELYQIGKFLDKEGINYE